MNMKNQLILRLAEVNAEPMAAIARQRKFALELVCVKFMNNGDFALINAHYLIDGKLIDLRAAKCGIAAIARGVWREQVVL